MFFLRPMRRFMTFLMRRLNVVTQDDYWKFREMVLDFINEMIKLSLMRRQSKTSREAML